MTTTSQQLRAAVRRLEQARTTRDRLIAERHAEGASLRTIAAEAGLTAPGVQKILRRRQSGRNTQPPPEAHATP